MLLLLRGLRSSPLPRHPLLQLRSLSTTPTPRKSRSPAPKMDREIEKMLGLTNEVLKQEVVPKPDTRWYTYLTKLDEWGADKPIPKSAMKLFWEAKKPTEAKPTEAKPSEAQPSEVNSMEPKSFEARSMELKPIEARSFESESTEARTTETRSLESKSTETKPLESKLTEPRSTETKPTETNPTETKSMEMKSTRPTDTWSAEIVKERWAELSENEKMPFRLEALRQAKEFARVFGDDGKKELIVNEADELDDLGDVVDVDFGIGKLNLDWDLLYKELEEVVLPEFNKQKEEFDTKLDNDPAMTHGIRVNRPVIAEPQMVLTEQSDRDALYEKDRVMGVVLREMEGGQEFEVEWQVGPNRKISIHKVGSFHGMTARVDVPKFTFNPPEVSDPDKRVYNYMTQHAMVVFTMGLSPLPLMTEHYPNAMYSVIDVSDDVELQKAIIKRTKWPTFPQIFVGTMFLGGDVQLESYHKTHVLRRVLMTFAVEKYNETEKFLSRYFRSIAEEDGITEQTHGVGFVERQKQIMQEEYKKWKCMRELLGSPAEHQKEVKRWTKYVKTGEASNSDFAGNEYVEYVNEAADKVDDRLSEVETDSEEPTAAPVKPARKKKKSRR